VTPIRPVRREDRDEWVRARHALFGDPLSDHERDAERYFRGEATEPQEVLVAVDGARVVGLAELSLRAYAEGCSTSPVAYLEGWWVAPEHRRRGLARRLVEAAESWARGRGCSELASDAENDNETSRLAHGRCGFEETGVIRCFLKKL
jgi:aminoglycoside 6'-N-acetyltransferase I